MSNTWGHYENIDPNPRETFSGQERQQGGHYDQPATCTLLPTHDEYEHIGLGGQPNLAKRIKTLK
jgi:hypothetical protein